VEPHVRYVANGVQDELAEFLRQVPVSLRVVGAQSRFKNPEQMAANGERPQPVDWLEGGIIEDVDAITPFQPEDEPEDVGHRDLIEQREEVIVVQLYDSFRIGVLVIAVRIEPNPQIALVRIDPAAQEFLPIGDGATHDV